MKLTTALVFGLFVALTLARGTADQAQAPVPARPDRSPALSPSESMKTIQLPPGYRLELVASEPMIQDPVVIDWDAEGRLWAVEMPGYMIDIKATGEHEPIGRLSCSRTWTTMAGWTAGRCLPTGSSSRVR
jgi:hypothetical protein